MDVDLAKLERLGRLRRAGALSEEEFAILKAGILATGGETEAAPVVVANSPPTAVAHARAEPEGELTLLAAAAVLGAPTLLLGGNFVAFGIAATMGYWLASGIRRGKIAQVIGAVVLLFAFYVLQLAAGLVRLDPYY